MAPLTLLAFFLFLFVSNVHCALDAAKRENILNYLNKPAVFVPGFLADVYMTHSETPIHPRLLMMDLNDSYDQKTSVLTSTFTERYFLENFANASELEVAAFVFQIDSLLDYMLACQSHSKQPIERLKSARKNIVACIQRTFPHRKLLLDMIIVSPSLRVPKATSLHVLPPSVYFQQVDYLCSLSPVNGLDVINFKCVLIGLLSSQMDDPSLSEHERQLWVSQFADYYFWMSSKRIAMCITAMLRGKLFSELLPLQNNFTQEQWGKVSTFLSLRELKNLPERFQSLINRNEVIGPTHILLDRLFAVFRRESISHASIILDIFMVVLVQRVDDLEIIAKYDSIAEDAFKKTTSLLDFSIATAQLLLVPELASKYKGKFKHILEQSMLVGPVFEVYSLNTLQVLGPTCDFTIDQMHCKMPTDLLAPIAVGLARNFRPVLAAFLGQGSRRDMQSLVRPEDEVALKSKSKYEVFTTLCCVISKYDMHSDDLIRDLEQIRFVDIMNSTLLDPHMKLILLEGVIGMHFCRNRSCPSLLSSIKIDESLSLTIGQLRGVKKTANIIEIFKFMEKLQSDYENQHEVYSSAYAVFMWAILPRILDDAAGADTVVLAFKTLVQFRSNKQFQYLERTALRMMLEHTPVKHISKVLSDLVDCGIKVDKVIVNCALSARKRASLISDLYDVEVSKYNLSFLLSLKQPTDVFSTIHQECFRIRTLGLEFVDAITLIGQGKLKSIECCSKTMLNDFFLRLPSNPPNDFADRIRYELDSRLHLSLIPKKVKLRIIELLCEIEITEKRSQVQLLQDVQTGKSFNSSNNSSKSGVFKSKTEQVKTTNDSIVRDISKPSEEAKNQRDIQANKKKSSELQPRTTVETNMNPERPSRFIQRNTAQTLGKMPNSKSVTIPQKETENQVETKKLKSHSNENELQEDKTSDQQSECSLFNPSVKGAPSEEQVEKEVKTKAFKLTIEVLRNNATLRGDGLVVPKDNCSADFIQFIREEVSEGFLPFQLDSKFLLFLTEGKHKDQFKNLGCKPIKNWKKREIWRPKLYTPIKVFGKGKEMTIKKTTKLTEFVYDLTKDQVARLQSLCFYSNACLTNYNRTLAFDVSSEYQSYQIKNGWIQIPQFPKTFLDFSNAIAVLTNSPVTAISEAIGRAAIKSRVAKSFQDRVVINSLVTDSVPAVSLLSVPNTKTDVPLMISSFFGNSSSQQQMDVQLDVRTSPNSVEVEKPEFNNSGSPNSSKTAKTPTTPLVANSTTVVSELNADSAVFVPETERLLSILKNFTKMKHMVTPLNYVPKMTELCELLQSDIEYVALDCEMTGLYTREDEAEHSRQKDTIFKNNTTKLMNAVDQNMMFQLGLTVKSLDGKFSVWSFYTAPSLTMRCFTPATFKFLFTKTENPSLEEIGKIEAKIENIAMNSVPISQLLAQIFTRKTPLVLFSGYVDLMYLRKAVNQHHPWRHKEFEMHMECDFYDVKQIAMETLHKPLSLELLMTELHSGLEMSKEHLHDASFDSLLTALAFDKLKKKFGASQMTKRLLFNYEKQQYS